MACVCSLGWLSGVAGVVLPGAGCVPDLAALVNLPMSVVLLQANSSLTGPRFDGLVFLVAVLASAHHHQTPMFQYDWDWISHLVNNLGGVAEAALSGLEKLAAGSSRRRWSR